MLELRHVQELRGARDDVQETRGADVSDTRWETRLLAVLAAILVVFGLAAVYGASSLVMISGGQVGSGFALRQALGAAGDRKSTRLNSSHSQISYAVFCL